MKNEIYLNSYINYLKLNLKKSTYDDKIIKLKKYIIDYFKEKDIKKISINDFIEWKCYIETFKFKYNYKSNIYYCFTTFLDYLMKYYNLSKNVARLEGNFKNYDITNNGSIWTIEEFNRFINVIENEKYKILFKLLFFTGMRKGELLALTWNDIDITNNVIYINKTITREHTLQTPKTKSSNRIISINKNLMNELIKFKTNNNELIFNISFTNLKRIKDKYCKISGVKQIKIHEFRHSHACLLYKNNIEIENISNRLGHSNMEITINTYLRNLPKNEKKVVKLLNSLC